MGTGYGKVRCGAAVTAAIVALVLSAGAANAGTISISIAHRLEIDADRITAIVTVRNSGDEAAHSLATALDLVGEEYRGPNRSTLEPGDSFEERLEIPWSAELEGRWSYRVAVDYTDANQYPFQALSVATLERGNPPPPKLALTAVSLAGLDQRAAAIVTVKNLSASERSAALRVVAPRGVEVPSESLRVTLAPWEDRPVEIELVNRFALAGSRYPLYAILEYDEGPVHQSVVAAAELTIIEAATVASSRSPVWIAALVLGLVFVALLAWRLASR